MESIKNRNNDQIDERYTNHWAESPYLIISMLITVTVIGVVLVLYVLHIFKWKPNYEKIDKEKFNTKEKFNPELWNNKECD